MRVMMATLLTGLAMTLMAATFSPQASAQVEAATIQTQGTGTVVMTADEARITFGIQERGSELPPLQKAADAAVAKLLGALQSRGIAEGDIAATAVRINPIYRYDQPQQKRIQEGYEVERSVTVLLRDIDLIGPVINEATSLGVDSVSTPVLSSSERETAYQQALKLAVAQARSRADAIAAAAGVSISGLVAVNTGGQASPPMPVGRLAMAADAESSSSYQAGDLTVRASVSAAFGIR